MGQTAQPFDVAKIVAEQRIREDRGKTVRKEAEEKLERELQSARERVSRKRIQELEAERLRNHTEQSRELRAVERTLDAEKARLKITTHRKPEEKPDA